MATTTDREASGGTLEGRDPELLRRLYEVMVHTRAVEDRMVAMYRSGDLLGSLYSGHRHEAISVGAASCLRADDHMAPLHRNLGAHLWKGIEPWQIMASFMGNATSPTGGRDGTLHCGRRDLGIDNLPSHIPANFPAATGMAFAAKRRGQARVCLAFCGDGSTSRGDFHESLTIASAQQLPNVFIPGVKVDGTDVLAGRGRRGGAAGPPWRGPVDRRGVTVRMHGHAEHDPADYGPKELYAKYAKKDPVELFDNVLVSGGVLAADTAKNIRHDARQAAIVGRRRRSPTRCPNRATSRAACMHPDGPPPDGGMRR